MNFNHIMGCPIECPRSPNNGKICSGNGVCIFKESYNGNGNDNPISIIQVSNDDNDDDNDTKT